MQNSRIENLHLLLGITGSVAAYKAVELASKLTTRSVSVKTVMTESACQLIGPKTLEAVTLSAVYVSLWQERQREEIVHIDLVDWSDVIVVSPATANIIGKIANGICDDLLSTILCAGWEKPKLLAPAMNNQMWNNPAVQQNVAKVKEIGYQLVGPVTGRLASGIHATGRMSEPDVILEAILQTARKIKKHK